MIASQCLIQYHSVEGAASKGHPTQYCTGQSQRGISKKRYESISLADLTLSPVPLFIHGEIKAADSPLLIFIV